MNNNAYAESKDVPCTYCNAAINESCIKDDGSKRDGSHSGRKTLTRKVNDNLNVITAYIQKAIVREWLLDNGTYSHARCKLDCSGEWDIVNNSVIYTNDNGACSDPDCFCGEAPENVEIWTEVKCKRCGTTTTATYIIGSDNNEPEVVANYV